MYCFLKIIVTLVLLYAVVTSKLKLEMGTDCARSPLHCHRHRFCYGQCGNKWKSGGSSSHGQDATDSRIQELTSTRGPHNSSEAYGYCHCYRGEHGCNCNNPNARPESMLAQVSIYCSTDAGQSSISGSICHMHCAGLGFCYGFCEDGKCTCYRGTYSCCRKRG